MLLLILAAVYVLIVAALIVVLLISGARPGKMIAWLLIIVVLPLLGPLAYVAVGLNRRELRFIGGKRGGPHVDYLPEPMRGRGDALEAPAGYTPEEQQILGEPGAVEIEGLSHPHLARLIIGNTGFRPRPGNRLTLLRDGADTRAAILEAVRGAEHFVHVEYYIVEGEIWLGELLDALGERRRAGCEVRFIYDGIGCFGNLRRLRRALDERDIQHAVFLPLKLSRVTSTFNYRNHRKIVVVDGRVGFTGGINISDKYLLDIPPLMRWRDLHLRLEGPVVRDLHAVFAHDWQRIRHDEDLGHARYFPVAESEAGGCAAQIIASDPDTDLAATAQAYLYLIVRAERRVRIINSYFIPDPVLLEALRTAALAGVDVRVLVPARSDSVVVKWAMQANFEDLLEAGVRIYRFRPAFLHSKAIAVDGAVASVGTANFDMRSFEQNYEVNALAFDAGLAHEIEAVFEDMATESTELDYALWKQRGRRVRLGEGLARLVSPLL